VNENKKKFQNGVDNVNYHGILHIVYFPNGHMLLGGEQGMFGLTYTSWWVNWI
jgi:hypothetical protein